MGKNTRNTWGTLCSGVAPHNNKTYYGNAVYCNSRKKYYILEDISSFPVPVDEDTLKEYTGMQDKNGDRIFTKDTVLFLGEIKGTVVFEQGAFGVAFSEAIHYYKIQEAMNEESLCCGNRYIGCMNDHFISLWEISSNFNCEQDVLYPLEIIESEE